MTTPDAGPGLRPPDAWPQGLRRVMGWRSDRVSGVMLLVIALLVLWQNASYPLGTLAEPGAGFVPLLLGIGLAAVAIVIVALGGWSARVGDIGWSEVPHAVAIFATLIAATAVFERLGYRLTIFAVVLILTGVVERRPVIPVLAIAAGFSLLTYLLFHTVLEIQLPRGPFGL